MEGKGLGVIAKEPIQSGTYITEYKYTDLYKFRDRQAHEREHQKNGIKDVCVLDAYIRGKKHCFDATLRINSYGR